MRIDRTNRKPLKRIFIISGVVSKNKKTEMVVVFGAGFMPKSYDKFVAVIPPVWIKSVTFFLSNISLSYAFQNIRAITTLTAM